MTTQEKVVYTVCETAKLLDLSLPAAYAAVERGEIPHLRIGRRILVPVVALEKLLASAGNRVK
ncbi:helix-turn-helix domain-containing protein [Chloroflexota bacterium]